MGGRRRCLCFGDHELILIFACSVDISFQATPHHNVEFPRVCKRCKHSHACSHLDVCSRSPGAADWSDRLAYGAGGTVVVCDPHADGTCVVDTLLVGHVGKVNCVRWSHSAESEHGENQQGHPVTKGLVSGGVDGCVIIWGPLPPSIGATSSSKAAASAGSAGHGSDINGGWETWGARAVLKGHTQPVTCVDALSSSSDVVSLVCSGSADGKSMYK